MTINQSINQLINKLKIAGLLTALTLTACVSSKAAPEKTYYVLQTRSEAAAPAVSGTPKVSIRRVKLPSYLNQQGITRLLPNGKANVSSTDLWAEKLSQAIPTLLAENLSRQLQSPVEIHPLPPSIRVNSVIEVNISRFIGDKDNLHLKGSYRLVKPQQLRTYQFATQVPLADNQTRTLVDAYATAISQLSQAIAGHL
ncbi:MAG: hypothetical protein CR974_02740 [Gammaproteobacteria bacterium]|nr:MAG: hypothetical protein CR974_02740 [Gammaproteobacteria bacterium]